MTTQHHYTSIKGQPPQWGSGSAEPQPTPATTGRQTTDLRAIDTVGVRLITDHRIHTGFDISSAYVEEFWTALLGPSSILMLRRIVRMGLEVDNPTHQHISTEALGQPLGLKAAGARRVVERLVMFKLAAIESQDNDTVHISVSTRIRPLTARKLRLLPPNRQQAHARVLELAGIPAQVAS